MSHVLAEVSGARDRSKALVFVRGFQGHTYWLGGTTQQTRWYRSLRDWGYTGRILTFRWHSPPSDCWAHLEQRCMSSNVFCAPPSERVEEAADAFFELLLRLRDVTPETTSLLGFSMGGWIIARALRIARRIGIHVRRAYLFGAAAPRSSRWPELLDAVGDRLWNFYSTEDRFLDTWCRSPVGVWGLPCRHVKARNVDCSTLIEAHTDWPGNVHECLTRARLTAEHL